jgi:hypothetical protein
MASPEQGPEASYKGPDEDKRPCPDCDPGLLDELKCRAMGIQAQAEYNALKMEELTKARTQFDAARSAYSAARTAATPTVQDLRQQLGQVIDQLKCLVDDSYEIELLDRAFAKVKERLYDCDPKSGCYFEDDCDFDEDVRDPKPEDIAGKIADIDRRTQAAKAAFDDLILEPTNLPKRVSDLQAEVNEIVTQMAADPRTVDFKQLYAAALVAQLHLVDIWRGFEHVNAYVDCLCQTLTCQLKGHTAISVLKYREAVDKCHRESAEARCQQLREHTTDEVMAEYIRIRSSHDDRHGEEPDEDREDEGRNRYRERERERDRDRYGARGSRAV